MTSSPGTYLQRDVGPRPILQVSELQVSVSIHKVDTEQLLTLRAAEAREALAHGPAALLHALGPVLALGPLTGAPGGRRVGRDLTELPTERERTQVRQGREKGQGVSFSPHILEGNSLNILGNWILKVTEDAPKEHFSQENE